MARLKPSVATGSFREFELSTLVGEELAELTPLALQKQINLVLESSKDVVVFSQVDARSIAMQNLLLNALNFAPLGSEIRVVIVQPDAADVHIRGEDSGPGIDVSLRDRVAESVYSSGNPNGAGLGLAMVRMVMKGRGAPVQPSSSRTVC